MLVYLSQFDSPDENYKQFQTLSSFHKGVLDSEATSIVCDNFLRTFEYVEIPELLKLIIKKLRIKGELVIKDLDIDLVSRHVLDQRIDLAAINDICKGSSKSLLLCEAVEGLLAGLEIVTKQFDENTMTFVIKARRVQ
ncbi:MAG: hypothetical protein CL833_05340 [Crocinitomicaceae bacterium]|nr:hypothetical protein [Crocinitomicaceae bacterium]|tara:strand:- start:4876 stop:5289 length:414 start_codon:yes stop_codon:yes gene_type:complete